MQMKEYEIIAVKGEFRRLLGSGVQYIERTYY